MDYTMIIYIILGIIGAGALYGINTKQFKAKGAFRNFVMIAGIALLAYGAVGALYTGGAIDSVGGAEAFFLAATGVQPQVQVQEQVQIQAPVTGARQRPIDTFSVISTVKNSNAHDTVAGYLRIFDPSTNPSDPTASALDSVTVSSGVGSSTNGYVKTDTSYRVVFDGDGTYYDKDFGIVTFPDANFNPSTGKYSFDMGEIVTVATIDDMLNESYLTGGYVNGETSDLTRGTAEIGTDVGSGNTDNLTYDESVGDGQWYIMPTLSASTAYAELQDAVMCFEFDTSTPPEGNEYSSIVYQLDSGSDLGFPSSELVNYWANQECVRFGTMTAGTSSRIKLLFTTTEANLDNNADIWYLGFDDLGSLRGKDLNLDTGATLDRIKFDSQA